MTGIVAIGAGKVGVGKTWVAAPFLARRWTSLAGRHGAALARRLASAG